MQSPPDIEEIGNGIWVVDKPSGMVVHPADSAEHPTAADLLRWLRERPGLPMGLLPVHRLDAQTSGLVLCAADPAVRAKLSEAFAQGAIQKSYLALVHGYTRKKGVIRRPLQDARRARPLLAETRYWTEGHFARCSFLQLAPQTGRKHQLRRHLQGIGHSIVGDDRYRSPTARPVPGAPARLWLHAWRLTLPDGQILEASLPPELQAHLGFLEAHHPPQPL